MRFGADPSCLENKTFEDAEEQKLVEWTKQLGKEDHPDYWNNSSFAVVIFAGVEGEPPKLYRNIFEFEEIQ